LPAGAPAPAGTRNSDNPKRSPEHLNVESAGNPSFIDDFGWIWAGVSRVFEISQYKSECFVVLS
jgi:hypothetical protein